MKDINTNKWKVKLYKDKETDCLKGDGLCTYIKVRTNLKLNYTFII